MAGVFRLTGAAGLFLNSFSDRWFPFTDVPPYFVHEIVRTFGGIFIATGIIGLIAGWGLYERRSWARILAIVLAFLSLLASAVRYGDRYLYAVGAAARRVRSGIPAHRARVESGTGLLACLASHRTDRQGSTSLRAARARSCPRARVRRSPRPWAQSSSPQSGARSPSRGSPATRPCCCTLPPRARD